MIIVHWHVSAVCATRINSLADFGYKVKSFHSERPYDFLNLLQKKHLPQYI